MALGEFVDVLELEGREVPEVVIVEVGDRVASAVRDEVAVLDKKGVLVVLSTSHKFLYRTESPNSSNS